MTTELFLAAMALIFALPWTVLTATAHRRLGGPGGAANRHGHRAGAGLLGQARPEFQRVLFTPGVVQPLNGLA